MQGKCHFAIVFYAGWHLTPQMRWTRKSHWVLNFKNSNRHHPLKTCWISSFLKFETLNLGLRILRCGFFKKHPAISWHIYPEGIVGFIQSPSPDWIKRNETLCSPRLEWTKWTGGEKKEQRISNNQYSMSNDQVFGRRTEDGRRRTENGGRKTEGRETKRLVLSHRPLRSRHRGRRDNFV